MNYCQPLFATSPTTSVVEEKKETTSFLGTIRSPRGRLSRKLEVISKTSGPSADN